MKNTIKENDHNYKKIRSNAVMKYLKDNDIHYVDYKVTRNNVYYLYETNWILAMWLDRYNKLKKRGEI